MWGDDFQRKISNLKKKNHFIFLHFIYNVEFPKVQFKKHPCDRRNLASFSPSAPATISTAIFKNSKKEPSVFICTNTFNFFELEFWEMLRRDVSNCIFVLF